MLIEIARAKNGWELINYNMPWAIWARNRWVFKFYYLTLLLIQSRWDSKESTFWYRECYFKNQLEIFQYVYKSYCWSLTSITWSMRCSLENNDWIRSHYIRKKDKAFSVSYQYLACTKNSLYVVAANR